ncbi:MAG: hypothetical protein HC930_02680 [Hydrococcus sp. SU_1_0]|nr:hypothetical protein [Hydrococcus sp. SU_1_0]
MRRTSRRRKNRLLRKMFRSCLFLLKAGFKTAKIVLKEFIDYLFFIEIILNGILLATASLLWYFLVASGISQNVASAISQNIVFIAIIIVPILFSLFIFARHTFSKKKQKLTRGKTSGEIKLAQWMTQTIANQNSTEWEEYQDWLHDIMLSRQQLLDVKCPRWQVSLITYKRLGVFWVVVGISKVKQVATSICDRIES